jgi:hypothetical protein
MISAEEKNFMFSTICSQSFRSFVIQSAEINGLETGLIPGLIYTVCNLLSSFDVAEIALNFSGSVMESEPNPF